MAKQALKHAPVVLDDRRVRAIAAGFAAICREKGFVVHACAIMPDHVHFVVARCDMLAEDIARRLKAKGTMALNKAGLGFTRSPWAEGEWKVFLNTPRDIRRAVRYVARNPLRAGLPRQRWDFVSPYAPPSTGRSKLRR